MNILRLLFRPMRSKIVLTKMLTPSIHKIHKVNSHAAGPPQPFDNLPFRVINRYICTIVFSVFFGVGFWAPFIIVWYSMAKKTM